MFMCTLLLCRSGLYIFRGRRGRLSWFKGRSSLLLLGVETSCRRPMGHCNARSRATERAAITYQSDLGQICLTAHVIRAAQAQKVASGPRAGVFGHKVVVMGPDKS
jgi:hypothetical protein